MFLLTDNIREFTSSTKSPNRKNSLVSKLMNKIRYKSSRKNYLRVIGTRKAYAHYSIIRKRVRKLIEKNDALDHFILNSKEIRSKYHNECHQIR